MSDIRGSAGFHDVDVVRVLDVEIVPKVALLVVDAVQLVQDEAGGGQEARLQVMSQSLIT
jgi:hypothetical protein